MKTPTLPPIGCPVCGTMMTWDTHFFFTTINHYYHCPKCCSIDKEQYQHKKCLYSPAEVSTYKPEEEA